MSRPIAYLFILLLTCFSLTNCAKENGFIDTSFDIKNDSIQQDINNENRNVILVNFKTYLQKEMEKQHIPALSVLIFEEEDILYEDYLGKSDLQKNISLQKDHSFLLASVSKVITATALLQLYEKGHFELDDNINDYLNIKYNSS